MLQTHICVYSRRAKALLSALQGHIAVTAPDKSPSIKHPQMEVAEKRLTASPPGSRRQADSNGKGTTRPLPTTGGTHPLAPHLLLASCSPLRRDLQREKPPPASPGPARQDSRQLLSGEIPASLKTPIAGGEGGDVTQAGGSSKLRRLTTPASPVSGRGHVLRRESRDITTGMRVELRSFRREVGA